MGLTKNKYNEQTTQIIFVIVAIYIIVFFAQLMSLSYSKEVPVDKTPMSIDTVFGNDFNQSADNEKLDNKIFPILWPESLVDDTYLESFYMSGV